MTDKKNYEYSILVRYAEIALKGKNKGDFEHKLVENIREAIRKQNISDFKIERKFSRILIETNTKEIDLTKVFGIYSYSYSKKSDISNEKSIDTIKKIVDLFLHDITQKTTFRVSAQRLDKNYPMNSTQIEKDIGAYVVEKTKAKVNLKNFEKEIGIEIIDGIVYVYSEKIRGSGGLPVGIEGKVLVLIEDKNSIDAGILIMKRGCQIIPISYEEKNLEMLEEYSIKALKLSLIKDEKEIDDLAKKYDAKALVVGQTLKNIKEINTNLLILRPKIIDNKYIDEK